MPFWLILAGCASQGPLKPPSLHLPAPARGLTAERSGDAVDLQWTTPTKTTDGLPLSGRHVSLPLEVDICRSITPTSPCQHLPQVQVAGGRADRFHDVLPPDLTTGPLRGLIYKVRILNGAGKGAAPAVVETLAGRAPSALQNLRAAPAENGVLILWQPAADSGADRVLLRVTRGKAAPVAESPAAQASRDMLLAVEPGTADRGGTLDVGAKPGVPQQYSVVRTRAVRVDGKDLVISSAPATAAVSADAKLPLPAPPVGLEAIANTLEAPEIDLVWQPSPSASGYRVFRSADAGPANLLTPEPIYTLTYSDKAVTPGVRYTYSVSAVGRDGQTGPSSNEVVEQLQGR